MAEIILFKGKSLSLGTEMNLWHVSYIKLFNAYTSGLLKQCSNANLTPEEYLTPDSVFRFRFPFDEEKSLPLGACVDFRKNIPVNIAGQNDQPQIVYISQQRCISRENKGSAYLATLYRDESGMNINEITDQLDAEDFTRQIVLNHILNEKDKEKQVFFRTLVETILDGYSLSITMPEK